MLRIEDTDQTREVEGAADALLDALQWCGVGPDEGPAPRVVPDASNPSVRDVGPYVQSQRLDLYHSHAQRLLDEARAYRCFCTPERLTALRAERSSQGLSTSYDGACARLDPAEAAARAASGESHTVRMHVRQPGGGGPSAVGVKDMVLGKVKFDLSAVDDQVLLKSDGFPTYHLASVVDDHLMGITHVIRGQEWLPSLPKHLMLYHGFGWKPPRFAHLPLLVNKDKSKLSKRQGDVSVEDFRARGYLPEALVNFVALLGWNPKDGSEVFSLAELEAAFDPAGLNKANAVVDRDRLNYFNSQHVRRLVSAGDSGVDRLAACALPFVQPVVDAACDAAGVARVDLAAEPALAAFKRALVYQHERVRALTDFGDLVWFCFVAPDATGPGVQELLAAQAGSPEERRAVVSDVLDAWISVAGGDSDGDGDGAESGLDKATVTQSLRSVAEAHSVGMKRVMMPIRILLTGMDVGAGLGELAPLLGRDECVRRLEAGLAAMP